MATYKVLQDIEAEDKFLGPLTLKQFIFASIAVVSAYVSFILLTKGLWVLVMPLVPLIIVLGFLAFPWGRDQPTEVWLLAKIRYMFKPRKRIWNQSGIQELVKITAPPPVQQFTGDNLSQTEVKSRLKALADTIDSRGWAIKNVSVNEFTQPAYGALASAMNSSDRLVDTSILPKAAPIIDVGIDSDIFENSNANKITSQIAASSNQHKQYTVNNLQDSITQQKSGQPIPDLWFMNEPQSSDPNLATFGTNMVSSAPQNILSSNFSSGSKTTDPNEAILAEKLRAKKDKPGSSFRNHKNLSPAGIQQNQQTQALPVTPAVDPVTIELARNNDRNIDSLARETNKAHPQPNDDEVIVTLH